MQKESSTYFGKKYKTRKPKQPPCIRPHLENPTIRDLTTNPKSSRTPTGKINICISECINSWSWSCNSEVVQFTPL